MALGDPPISADGRFSLMVSAKARFREAGLKDLATIRRFTEDAAATCRDPDAVSELILALNEAVTNVIVHGYKGRPGAIEISVEANDRCLRVCIRDQAPYFDPTSVPAPDTNLPLNERRYGGMGVHMMRQFTDSLHYEAIPSGGNELVLEKRVTG